MFFSWLALLDATAVWKQGNLKVERTDAAGRLSRARRMMFGRRGFSGNRIQKEPVMSEHFSDVHVV